MVIQVLLVVLSSFNLTSCSQENAVSALTEVAAVVKEVKVSGNENAYSFSVTVKSPDKGCSQYANWWEVITADGNKLLYRRILAHSHVSEQPFTRSGGAVDIAADTEVIIRAHMFPSGYGEGEITLIGSVSKGFTVHRIETDFAKDLEGVMPQPTGCAF